LRETATVDVKGRRGAPLKKKKGQLSSLWEKNGEWEVRKVETGPCLRGGGKEGHFLILDEICIV